MTKYDENGRNQFPHIISFIIIVLVATTSTSFVLVMVGNSLVVWRNAGDVLFVSRRISVAFVVVAFASFTVIIVCFLVELLS